MDNFGLFIRTKCMNFSVRIVNLCKYLTEEKKEFVLSKQVLRSGTSIGANLVEAQNAISKKDFLAKLFISQKECAETQYWLELLMLTEYISKEQYESINNDCTEIIKLLVSTTKKLKAGNN